MLYQTPVFLPFLLVNLFIYWRLLHTRVWRTRWIAASSAVFLIAAQIETVTLEYACLATGGVILLSLLVYFLGRQLTRNGNLALLAIAIVAPLSVLGLFKYFAPISSNLGYPLNLIAPMGVSYYTFKFISYLIECSRGKFADADVDAFLAYILFFPMFTAGPIERFGNFLEQLNECRFSWDVISTGLERIAIGVAFKFVISDFLVAPFVPPGEIMASEVNRLDAWQVFLASLARFLRTYFDFAGYTHMVIGVGLLFGIKLMENFNSPLLRQNLAEFWRAWHISLSGWARDYIYFPVLGKYRSTSLALIATMMMIGAWHSPAPGWLLWGLHHGVGLVLLSNYHRWAEGRPAVQALRNTAAWRFFGMLATWWYVAIGYGLTFVPYDVITSLTIYGRIVTLGLWN